MFFLVCEQTFVLLTKQEIANVNQSNDACILAARFDTQQTSMSPLKKLKLNAQGVESSNPAVGSEAI